MNRLAAYIMKWSFGFTRSPRLLCRVRRELDACRERLLQLALAHPGAALSVTDTLQRQTLLSLPKARCPAQQVCQHPCAGACPSVPPAHDPTHQPDVSDMLSLLSRLAAYPPA